MKNTSNHPEQVKLLSVVQADPLHGHTHPVKVTLVVKKRVLQSTDLLVLQTSASESRSGGKQIVSKNLIHMIQNHKSHIFAVTQT